VDTKLSTETTKEIPSQRRQMVKNVISNWGTFFVTAGISFVLAPFVVHSLGNEAYGAWVLLGSLVGYLGLLDLGVRGAVTKYVATHHARRNHPEASQVASAALTLFSGFGLLAVLAAFTFAQFGLQFFEISDEFADAARFVLRLGGATIGVSIIGGVFGGIVVGRQRFDLINGVSVTIEVVRGCLVFLALRAGGGLVELALIQFGIALAQTLASLLLSRRVYPELKIWFFACRAKHLNIILSYGFFSALIHSATMLIGHTDSLIIGIHLPVSLITFYAIAWSLVEQTRSLVSGISHVITPLAGALDGQNNTERVGEVLVTGARYATLASLPIVLTFIVRGHSFIGLWMGKQYAEPAGDVLVLLAFGVWVYAGFQVCCGIMMGLNRHSGLVPAFVLEALCNLGLSVWWVQSYGIYGVALGTLIPRLVICLLFGPWYNRRVVGVGITRFLGETLLRPSVSMLPFALGSWLIERHWPASNLLVYFGQIAMAGPLALLGAWFVFLSAKERRDYSARIQDAWAARRR
jgi:O-antigen/teichoic acid export membrane protein